MARILIGAPEVEHPEGGVVAWVYDEGMAQGSRAQQEDDYGIFELPPELEAGDLLLVLADGMGGEQAGARASTLAVRSFVEVYDIMPDTVIPARLEQTLAHVNARMAQDVASDPRNLSGMGCTLLAVVLTAEGLYWVSVGDSPLWLWRRGQLHRLNQDHAYRSVLLHQVSQGEISAAEAACHPDRNALMSAVTGTDLELVDLPDHVYPLRDGDQILLASDGLLTLDEDDIAMILSRAGVEGQPVEQLLAAVAKRQLSHQDNVTALWVRSMAFQSIAPWWHRPAVRVSLLAGLLGLLTIGGIWWWLI